MGTDIKPNGTCFGCGKKLTPWKKYGSTIPEPGEWKGYPTITRAFFHSLRCAALFAECAAKSGFTVEMPLKTMEKKA